MTDLKIAFIILPLRDNQGRKTTAAHEALRTELFSGGLFAILAAGVCPIVLLAVWWMS